MKKKSIIAGLIVAMFVVFATAGLADAEDPITGTIAQDGDMFVLDAADGSYVLEGDVTPDMVGKKVAVTGAVAEKDGAKVISVVSMEEVAEWAILT